jgi:uncharacterized membrane protein YgdD (TMEM256/DUF423 family)
MMIAAAGLAGSAGIGEAALAAHGLDSGNSSASLQTSANFLLLHATAIVAITSFAHTSERFPRYFLSAAFVLLLGTIIFCGDLTLRALAGSRLFVMAAPLGGSLLIAGWLFLAIIAITAGAINDNR